MTSRRAMVIGGVAATAFIGWVLFVGLPLWFGGAGNSAAVPSAAGAPAPPGRRIKATLLYVSEDGMRLTRVEREVAFGEGTVEQARQIIEAQIAPVAEPLVSAVPPGTKLRALFVTESGEAYVDFSRELASGHSGGSTSELLTVYTIVDVLGANLPAIHSVQLLLEGKQMGTLAGHVDLQRPLETNLAWVQ